MYTSACIFVFLLHCFLGCIECYFYYFYFFFYYLFLLSISFFLFDMDHWSDTNKWLIDWNGAGLFLQPGSPHGAHECKGEGAYTSHSASSQWITTAEALRYGTCMFYRDLTVLSAHPHVHLQSEWAIPAFAFPAAAGTHLPTPERWKAE